MANKYIYQGSTFCGDGTASNEAASAGAVGAWNNIDVLEGTAPAYGTAPAAGDVVYIRSKDAAGANITRTISAANVLLGSTTATTADPVSWIIDGGTIWPGINGVITYTTAGANCYLAFRSSNYFEAEVKGGLAYTQTNTWPAAACGVNIYGYVKNATFTDANTSVSNATCAVGVPRAKAGAFGVLDSCSITAAKNGNGVINIGGASRLINTDIEVTGYTGNIIFCGDSTYTSPFMEVYGGRLFGAGVGSTTKLVTFNEGAYNYACRLFAVGFSVPVSVGLAANANTWANSSVELIGLDGGVGAVIQKYWGFANSRPDNNPPTLLATFPDSTSKKWAWRLAPERASSSTPAQLTFSKLYTSAAATLTVGLEFLVANTLAPTKRNVWITVVYTDDATGLTKQVSTFSPGAAALDASTVGWSTVAWGLTTCVKRKLTVALPTSVKQDTLITVLFNCALGQATVDDILFIDPDFAVL